MCDLSIKLYDMWSIQTYFLRDFREFCVNHEVIRVSRKCPPSWIHHIVFDIFKEISETPFGNADTIEALSRATKLSVQPKCSLILFKEIHQVWSVKLECWLSYKSLKLVTWKHFDQSIVGFCYWNITKLTIFTSKMRFREQQAGISLRTLFSPSFQLCRRG